MVAPSHQLSRIVVRVSAEIYERVHQQVERRKITVQAWAHERLIAALEGAEAVATEPGADLTRTVLHLESRLTGIVAKAQEAGRLRSWVKRAVALYVAIDELVRDQKRLADQEAYLAEQLAAARRELTPEPALAVEAEQTALAQEASVQPEKHEQAPAAAIGVTPAPATAPARADLVEPTKVEPEKLSPANTGEPRERKLQVRDFATPLEAALAMFREQGIDVGGS